MKIRTTDTGKLPEFISGNLAVLPQADTDPFHRLIHTWLDSCKAAGLADKTLVDYREKVFKFWWWWDYMRYTATLGQHPKFVTLDEAEKYVVYLRSPNAFRWGITGHNRQTDNLSPASIASYGRPLKAFFNWLKRRRHITENPFSEVSFATRKQNKVVKVVPENDLQKIFDYLTQAERANTFLGTRNLAILAMLLDSGIRKGELLSITLARVDMENNQVEVNGKTGMRVAVFGEVCRRAVANYLVYLVDARPNDPLWQCEDGAALQPYGFSSVISRLRKQVGVNFHAHQLRHTFATMMAAKGVGIRDLQQMLGHDDIATTQIYLETNVERQHEVHREFSPLNKLAGEGKASIKRRGRPRRAR